MKQVVKDVYRHELSEKEAAKRTARKARSDAHPNPIKKILNDTTIDVYSDKFAAALYKCVEMIYNSRQIHLDDQDREDCWQDAICKFYEKCLPRLNRDENPYAYICTFLEWKIYEYVHREARHKETESVQAEDFNWSNIRNNPDFEWTEEDEIASLKKIRQMILEDDDGLIPDYAKLAKVDKMLAKLEAKA